MMETLVSCGFGSARMEGIVGIESTAGVLGDGFIGVAGRECERYQAKTTGMTSVQEGSGEWVLRTFVAELGGVCGRAYDGKVGAAEEGADCGLHCVAGAAMRVGFGSEWSEVASDVRCQMAGVACDG